MRIEKQRSDYVVLSPLGRPLQSFPFNRFNPQSVSIAHHRATLFAAAHQPFVAKESCACTVPASR